MDLRVNVFASSGDLNQISYANKAVERGSTTAVVIEKDSVLVVVAPVDSAPFLVRPHSRVVSIDDCLHCVCVGYKPDIAYIQRGLVESAQKHRTLFDERIPLHGIAQDTAERMCGFMRLRRQREASKPGFYDYSSAGLGGYEPEETLGSAGASGSAAGDDEEDEERDVVGRPLAAGVFLIDTLDRRAPGIARVLNAGQIDFVEAAVLGEGSPAFHDVLQQCGDGGERRRRVVSLFRKRGIRPQVFRIRKDEVHELPHEIEEAEGV